MGRPASGIRDRQFLRLTLHEESVNELFLDVCAEVARDFERGGLAGCG